MTLSKSLLFQLSNELHPHATFEISLTCYDNPVNIQLPEAMVVDPASVDPVVKEGTIAPYA